MNAANNIYQIAEMREKYQIENGEFTRLCNAIIVDLAEADINKIHYKILLIIIRETYGYGKKTKRISINYIANKTRLNTRTVKRGIKELMKRNILYKVGGQRSEIGYQKYPEKWLESESVQNIHSRFESVQNIHSESVQNNHHKKRKKEIYTSTKVDVGHLASQDAPGTPAKSNPSIPFQKVVDLYHKLLPNCPKVQKLNEKRKGYIRQRFIQNDLPDLDTWREYFNYCAKSPFLMGKSNGTNGRPPFIANLEWITNPSHFTDIWEGKYHRS